MIIYSQHIAQTVRFVSDCLQASNSHLDSPVGLQTNSYLEIRLPKSYFVTKVVTQGAASGYVQKFRVQSSENGENFEEEEISGNSDTQTKTASVLKKFAQLVRVYPLTKIGSGAFCCDLIIDTKVNTKSEHPPMNSKLKTVSAPGKALKMSYKLGAVRKSSSESAKFETAQSYLESPNGWVPSAPENAFIQTQFQSEVKVKALIIKGSCTRVQLQTSSNNQDFIDAGTFDLQAQKVNQIPLDFEAKTVRIVPVQFNQLILVQYDLLVETDAENESQSNGLLLSKDLSFVTRKVSDCFNMNESQYGACQSYLDGPKSWCPMNQQKIYGQYIEIDFSKKVLVGQIITQGRNGCCWVTKYKVEYSINGEWRQGGEFVGNSDSNSKAVRNTHIVAEKIRIYPIEYHEYIDIRVDVAVSEDLSINWEGNNAEMDID
ncbi:F5/8_type C domain-containing protein [Hexamita inflata]|uniref:F5/8 type C domain-containing protein n=1 Tax=Hexamita inflata TaxID=28002 RepID=A0AA86PU25_9EUKA|nr:F5/8 type C domain-containing protein [Hexamita inflata]